MDRTASSCEDIACTRFPIAGGSVGFVPCLAAGVEEAGEAPVPELRREEDGDDISL